MEFHEILAIAQKRQREKDKEVKEIDHWAKLKRLERLHEFERTRQNHISEKPTALISKPPNRDDKETHSTSEKNASKSSGSFPPQGNNIRPTNALTKRSVQNASSNNGMATTKKLAKSVQNLEDKKHPVLPATTGDISKPQKQKKSSLSFAELLELAKRNETVETKKQAFDDLIPCKISSLYTKKDADSKNVDIDDVKPSRPLSAENLKPGHSRNPPSLRGSTTAESRKVSKTSQVKDSIKIPRTSSGTTKPSSSQSNARTVRNGTVGRVSMQEVNAKHSELRKRSDCETNKKPQVTKVSSVHQPIPTPQCSSRNSVPRSAIAIQLQSRAVNPVLPNGSANKRPAAPIQNTVSVKKSEQINPQKQRPPQTEVSNDSRTRCTSYIPASSDLKPKVKTPPRGPVVPSRESVRIPSNRPQSRPSPPATCRATGIAAQLGVSLSLPKRVDDSEPECDYSEDDYESDDSFIDDSDMVESKEYARVVRDIHKALHFDPRKYKEVNPWDDLRSMEANYREIEKEERRRNDTASHGENQPLHSAGSKLIKSPSVTAGRGRFKTAALTGQHKDTDHDLLRAKFALSLAKDRKKSTDNAYPRYHLSDCCKSAFKAEPSDRLSVQPPAEGINEY
ncbi:unnamed protein product [Echinostoma caproni]|uniref:Protein SPT2 homolog n=1 Tax=Echinostoma caproni TaxID=27848 RepID=A0A183A163_9TREM|nr:unnamed protein product [Echinostoma caproni]